MIAFLTLLTVFLLCFAVANYRRAEHEKKIRLRLEEESETFHTVLLEHLGEWKYWRDERDLTLRAARLSAMRGKVAREALEFIAEHPSHPKIMDTMVEIPGVSCQRARDALASMTQIIDNS